MTNKPPPAVSKYKKTFEQKFTSDVADTRDDQTAIKTWGVTRDAASIGINFILPNERQSFPYTYLQRWRLTETGEIQLKFSEGLVTITGKDLAPLYQDICRYRLHELTVESFSNGTVVDAITIKLNDEAGR
ncbi:MAG: hypothetical protein MJA28_11985 [Gammaproteobacteria bacterium]|nr:hypothetical protein [Gammaproteobacteria bacterium]